MGLRRSPPIFFFVAGLELKRELLVGSLRRLVDAAVPVFAAACGVAVPVAVFVVVNRGTDNLGGWAISAATDIALALAAISSVVGSALPSELRPFLLTLAVLDDLIVIVVIAVFHTTSIHLLALLIAIAITAVLLPPRVWTGLGGGATAGTTGREHLHSRPSRPRKDGFGQPPTVCVQV